MRRYLHTRMDARSVISDATQGFDPKCYEDFEETLAEMLDMFMNTISENGFEWGDNYKDFITHEDWERILSI